MDETEECCIQEKDGIYAGRRTLSWFQIHKRMVSRERHQRRPLDDLATCSPDLNPIENYWSLLNRELYVGGKQYSSKESLWGDYEEAKE